MKPITGKASFSVLLGAAFLMATSSIGQALCYKRQHLQMS